MKFLKFLIVFFFLIICINGFALTQNWHGYDANIVYGAQAQDWFGFKIEAINSAVLNTVQLFPLDGTAPTDVNLMDANCVQLTTGTITDLNSNLNYELTAGETYYIAVGKPSGTWDLNYNSGAFYPQISTDINWIRGMDLSNGTCDNMSGNVAHAIKYLYTGTTIPSPNSVSNFTFNNSTSGTFANNEIYSFDFEILSDWNYLNARFFHSFDFNLSSNEIIDLNISEVGGTALDGFEDGDYNALPAWSESGTGDANVLTVAKKFGNYGLKLDTSGSYKDIETTIDGNAAVWSTWVYNGGNADNLFVEEGSHYLSIYGTAEYIYYRAYGGVGTQFYASRQTNKWYKYKIIYYNGDTTVDFYLYDSDEVLLASAVGITTTALTPNEVRLRSYGSNYSYFDNVAYGKGLINCDGIIRAFNPVNCSYDWNVSGLIPGKYYFDVNVTDEASLTLGFQSIGGFVLGSDTTFPTLDFNVISETGFVSDFNATAYLTCYDNSPNDLNYSIKLNDVNIFTSTDANATNRNVFTDLNIGENIFTFSCTDASGNTTTQNAPALYASRFHLVNEQTGETPVDLNKAEIINAFVFTYDSNYSYDFNATSTTSKNFIDFNSIQRFEFTYEDDTIISREVDVSLINDQNIGICVAPYQQFYEQLILSNTKKTFYLYNDFAKCYNMATSTKFAYKTRKMARGITINKPYYLYIFSGTTKSLLTLIEGSIAVETNLDTLELNEQDFNVSVYDGSVSFEPLLNSVTGLYDTNTMRIYYNNPFNLNDSTKLQIYNDSNLLWTYTESSSPNDFLINFYYFPYSIDSNDMLSVIITSDIDGTETTSTYYFTIFGVSGKDLLNPLFVIVLVFMLMIFGLTFVAYRFAFGWFGLMIAIVGIILLSFVPGFWYVRVAQAVMLIAAIFIALVFKFETARVV